jgi:hypothetical protein
MPQWEGELKFNMGGGNKPLIAMLTCDDVPPGLEM